MDKSGRVLEMKILSALLVALGAVVLVAVSSASDTEATYIEGRVVSGDETPEAGVWVIAETDALATPYRKIVVTDDLGRFVVPDLPRAEYQLWVRGYGLRDSAKIAARPGASISLGAEKAASSQQAAAIYPANYWFSLFEPPEKTTAFVSQLKLGCELCHQVGSLMTRSRTRSLYDLGLRKASAMNAVAEHLGRERLLDALSAWSGRIASGVTPPAPPRPRGIERNFVITQWGWGDEYTYAHDEVATDKRDPSRRRRSPPLRLRLAGVSCGARDYRIHGEVPKPREPAQSDDGCRGTGLDHDPAAA